jgi:hypothetical protein
MEVLLIDMGALAMFLAYMAIVYWHGVSHEAQPPGHRSPRDRSDLAGLRT